MNEKAKAGRPRDPHLDEALLQAAYEVFLDRGYQHASLSEVARKAGVGTPAIYRRWPTKAAMAVDVMERAASRPDPIPDTGSIRDDLAELFRARVRLFGSALFHRMAVPVMLEASADNHLDEQIRQRFVAYRQANVLARIRGAIASGELRADTDPVRLLDVLHGPITMALLFSQPLPDASQAQEIVDQVLDGFAAR